MIQKIEINIDEIIFDDFFHRIVNVEKLKEIVQDSLNEFLLNSILINNRDSDHFDNVTINIGDISAEAVNIHGEYCANKNDFSLLMGREISKLIVNELDKIVKNSL